MRRLAPLLAGLLLAVAVVPSIAAAQTPLPAGARHGKFLQACPQAHMAQVDPIVSPGAAMSAHMHTQQGSRAWGASSKTGDMLAGGTTCVIPGNDSAYWVPTVRLADGTQLGASFHSYYGGFGKDSRAIAGGRIQPFPPGLRILAGNPASTVPQSTAFQQWRCVNAQGQAVYINDRPQFNSCPQRLIQGTMGFPSCWDGDRLDSPDHKSHVAYAQNVTASDGVARRGCPTSHPVALPEIQAEWNYSLPAGKSWVNARLSSDKPAPATQGSSWHADYWAGWDSMAQSELVKCLNDPARNSPSSPLCGLFTFSTNNYWLSRLNAWANAFPYVKPDGNPGVLPPALTGLAAVSAPLCHLNTRAET